MELTGTTDVPPPDLAPAAVVDEPADPSHDWPGPAYWARATLAVVAVLALCFAVVKISAVLVLGLTAMVLAVGLQRPIAWMERRGVRRGAAVAILAVSVIAVIGGFLALVLPSVLREASALAEQAPDYLRRLRKTGWVRAADQRFDLTDRLSHLGDGLPDQAWSIGRGLLGIVVDALTVSVLTICFAVDLPRARTAVGRLLVPKHRARFETIADQVTVRVGGYVTGNLIVSVIAGVTSFIALFTVGVPYAAALAVWVALTDLLPAIGALLGAAVAMAVAGFSGGIGDLVTIGVFFLIYQQLENYVVVPRVMKGAIDMSVAAVLVAILVGNELFGLVGVLLALPIAATVQTVLDELYLRERRRSVRMQEVREARLRRWLTRFGRAA